MLIALAIGLGAGGYLGGATVVLVFLFVEAYGGQ